MFCWTDDMISFMNDAASFGSYQNALADWICEALPGKTHVCDAGCGLGFLSVRLAGRFEQVTAADISAQALSNLRRMAGEQGISNLDILETDMMRFTPERAYDAMVFCLFGRMKEILRVAKRCCAGKIVVIKKAYTHHRFSVSSVPLRDEVTDQAAEFLRAHGVAFELETKTFDMGQPLRDLDGAVRFFETYSKDAPGTVTREAVLPRLMQTGDKTFPYYLPQEKSLGRFVIDTRDIPEEFL